MTASREILVLARHNLMPSWFAYVNGTTGTPLRVVILYGTIKGAWLSWLLRGRAGVRYCNIHTVEGLGVPAMLGCVTTHVRVWGLLP